MYQRHSRKTGSTDISGLTKRAESGDATAQNQLGVAYSRGQSVDKDYEAAARWFLRSAEQGNPDGQVNLGVAYGKGQGVKQDDIAAVKWFRKAAEQGNSTG
jgi:TPR repeat protein